MAQSEQEDYRTDNMGEVSLLRYFDHTPQRTEWSSIGKGTCYWFFMRTEALEDLVRIYQVGEARVEPRKFNRLFGETKAEFYELYDQAKAG